MKRRKFGILYATTAVLLVAQSQAAVLLDDTFADGSRGELNLPTESPVWVSHAGDVTMGAGSLAYAQTTSSHKMWTYFAGNGAPISLGVGEQLIATVDFTPRNGMYDSSSKNFRFGLFNDPTDAQVTTDVNSDGGGSGSPWTDSTGYGVHFALSTGVSASSSPSVGKRTDQSNTSLLGSGGAWTLSSGGSAIVGSLDTKYTLTLALDRLAVDQMGVTFSIADAGGVISTHSIIDDPNGTAAFGTSPIATNFDQLFFRFSSATATADVLDFSRIKIEYIAVPEPTSAVLLGLGLFGLIAARRNRR